MYNVVFHSCCRRHLAQFGTILQKMKLKNCLQSLLVDVSSLGSIMLVLKTENGPIHRAVSNVTHVGGIKYRDAIPTFS